MYRSLNAVLRAQYGCKVYKLALDGGMTCPTRDGTTGRGGCLFCSRSGSGEFAAHGTDIAAQLAAAKQRVAAKGPAKYIAYFQSYTNTYAPAARLRGLFAAAMAPDDVVALSIATRPDCLPEDVLSLLGELNRHKPVWVELGLQTIHPETAAYLRRGYALPVFDRAVAALKQRGLTVVAHMILGLPGETPEMMYDTARYLARSGVDGVKFHLLHVLDDADLAADYRAGRFRTLELDEYIGLLEECIRLMPPQMVIHRLTGDGDKNHLIAPLWSADKKRVLNAIKAAFDRDGVEQGAHFSLPPESEKLTIYDETLRPLYVTTREKAHEQGLFHEVVHCWIASRDTHGVSLWFQQRAYSKKDYPGLYDLAVGGHVGAGEAYQEAMAREIREEIGLNPAPDRLRYLGVSRRAISHRVLCDQEFARVFLLLDDHPAFSPGEEVASMIRLPLAAWLKRLDGAPSVTAYRLDGTPITIAESQWAGVPNDFFSVVYPALRREFSL